MKKDFNYLCHDIVEEFCNLQITPELYILEVLKFITR